MSDRIEDRIPFFGHAPRWVYATDEYATLNGAQILLLHLIAGQCIDGPRARRIKGGNRGGVVGRRIVTMVGGPSANTLRAHAQKLQDAGFIVKVFEGGGRGHNGDRLANEYAIPDAFGSLDHARCNDTNDSPGTTTPQKLRGKSESTPAKSEGLAGTKRKLNPAKIESVPRKNCVLTPQNLSFNPSESERHNTSSYSEKYSGNTQRQPEDDFSNDDDQALLELAAASEDERTEALIREGVHRPRAKKLAGVTTGHQVREAILTLREQPGPIQNPAGYLCDVLKALMDEHTKAAEAVQAEGLREFQSRVEYHLQRAPTLPDDALLDALDAQGLLTPGLTADFIRGKSVWLESVAKHLARQELEGAHTGDSQPASVQQNPAETQPALTPSKALSA